MAPLRITLLVFVAAMLAAPAFAAGSYPDNKPLPESLSAEKPKVAAVAPADTNVIEPVGKLLVGLGVLAAIFVVGVFLVRRNPNLRRYLGTGGPLRVLSRIHLGARQSVYLLRVGERVLVVGSGSQGLTTLSEIRESHEVARLTAESGGGAGSEFKQALRAGIREAERESAPVARGEPPVKPSDRLRPTAEVLDRAISGVTGAARDKLSAIRAELARISAEGA